jgi:4-amino-4-deoxy-L-arabinose transferase-like glycosyltransferase
MVGSLANKLKIAPYYLWIAALTFAVRAGWAIAVPVIPVSDSIAYDTFAQNLATCNVYGWDCHSPSAYWPVGPSFVYSLFYRLFGHSYLPIVLLNLLLAVVTVGLLMHLAHSWFGRRVAALSGILYALWFSQIQFTTVLASEQMFNALMVGTLSVWRLESGPALRRWGAMGALLAAASYIKPIALLIPFVLVLRPYRNLGQVVSSAKQAIAALLVMAMLIAPWSIRNTLQFQQFVTISTNGGANLWMGNNPASTGEYMDLPPETNGMNEAHRDKYLKTLAVAHIKENPGIFVRRTIERTITTYGRESIGVSWNEAGLKARWGQWSVTVLKVLNQLYWLPMLFLGMAGVVMMGIKQGWMPTLTHPLVSLWGYFAAIHAIIVAQDRYHFPSIPMIAICAAYALIAVIDFQAKRRAPAAADSDLHPAALIRVAENSTSRLRR